MILNVVSARHASTSRLLLHPLMPVYPASPTLSHLIQKLLLPFSYHLHWLKVYLEYLAHWQSLYFGMPMLRELSLSTHDPSISVILHFVAACLGSSCRFSVFLEPSLVSLSSLSLFQRQDASIGSSKHDYPYTCIKNGATLPKLVVRSSPL